MIASLKPYPAYKKSGVSWLEQVPENWRVLRGKNAFCLIDVRSETGNEELLTVSARDGVVPRSEKKVTMFKAESYVGHKLCWPGDLVINSLWAWMYGLGFSRYHGLVSSAYSVYRPKNEFRDYEKFFHYLLRSSAYKWELVTRSKGVWISRLQLLDDAFFDMPILIPPPEDQEAIVRFLEHADARIRRAVEAKRRLIALLDEEKQAVIHRAVTRGLDPDVPLKPSGVEWLGEIPIHWDLKRLRSILIRIDQGVSPQAEARLAESDVWGVLKSGCVNHGVFRDTEHKRLPDNYEIDESVAVRVGDVLVSRACGSPKLVGSVGRVEDLRYHLILSDKTYRLVFRNEEIVDFAVLAMNSSYFRIQIEQAISGAEGLANNLPLSSLKDFRLVVPPRNEAQSIASDVRLRTIELQTAIAATKREIDLLLEFRTRLIADVVTGKLDVRGVAAGLPETTPGQATLDAFDAPAGDEEDAWTEPGAALEDGDGIGA